MKFVHRMNIAWIVSNVQSTTSTHRLVFVMKIVTGTRTLNNVV